MDVVDGVKSRNWCVLVSIDCKPGTEFPVQGRALIVRPVGWHVHAGGAPYNNAY